MIGTIVIGITDFLLAYAGNSTLTRLLSDSKKKRAFEKALRDTFEKYNTDASSGKKKLSEALLLNEGPLFNASVRDEVVLLLEAGEAPDISVISVAWEKAVADDSISHSVDFQSETETLLNILNFQLQNTDEFRTHIDSSTLNKIWLRETSGISIDDHHRILNEREKEIRTELAQVKEAESKERFLLEIELTSIQHKLSDLENSFKEKQTLLAEANASLTEFKDKVSEEQFQKARDELEKGNSTAAAEAFVKIAEQNDLVAAKSYYEAGRLAEDQIRYVKAYEFFQKAVMRDESNSIFLSAVGNIALRLGKHDKAIEYYELALALKTYDEDHRDVAACHSNLGGAWQALGKHHKAIEYHELALALVLKAYDEDHPDVAAFRNNLGRAWQALGEHHKAIEYHELALASALKTYDEDHSDVTASRSNLGTAWQALGKHHKAIEYHELALASALKTYDEDNPNIGLHRNNLGLAWQALGEHHKAIEYHELALVSALKAYDEDHPDVAACRNNLGIAWQALGEYYKAIEYYELALASDLKTYAEGHPKIAIRRNNLGVAWQALGEHHKAIECHELALASDLKTYAEGHSSIATDRNNLGLAWKALGEYQKAIEYYELALASDLKAYREDHPNLVTTRNNLRLAWQALERISQDD